MWTQQSRDDIAKKKKSHLERQDYTMNKLVRRKKKSQSHGTNTSSYLLAGLLWVSSSTCYDAKKCSVNGNLQQSVTEHEFILGIFPLFPWSVIKLWPFFFFFLLHLVQKPNCPNVIQPAKPFFCETLAVRLCIDSGCTLGLLPVYWGRGFGSATLRPEDLKILSLTLPESARCDSCHCLTCERKINWANKVSSHPPATAIMLYECATGPFSRAQIYVYIHHEYMYIYIFKDTFKFRLMLRQKKSNPVIFQWPSPLVLSSFPQRRTTVIFFSLKTEISPEVS